jgi:Zn-dependent peptidase ImmA (M78 family)
VTDLPGVNVYPIEPMPIKGLLSASQPTGLGGDILIDGRLPLAERRVTLVHELKHIIDGGHGTRPHHADACSRFALNVLIPVPWLRTDWQGGNHNVSALAERYQVPEDLMHDRLYELSLLRRAPPRPRLAHRVRCQSQSHIHEPKLEKGGKK